MMLASINVDSTHTNDTNSVKNQLAKSLKWGKLIRCFASNYEEIANGVDLQIFEFNGISTPKNSIAIFAAETATQLFQEIIKWVEDRPWVSDSRLRINGMRIHHTGLRIAFRFNGYTHTARDPYQEGKEVTGVYLHGGLGVKTHPLTCVVRDYINLGYQKCDYTYVVAWYGSQHFEANAEKWDLPAHVNA